MLFTMRVKMLSDWHIGLGQSKGDIDSLIQRDSDGLPYIPAKTLTGILRDSCELVASGLDSGNEKGVWSQWVNFLFGSQPALEEGSIESSPQPAIISLRSAHFPDSLKNALTVKTKVKVKDSIAFIKPGISIDNDTGCAKTDFLRFEEMIRKGAILDAKDCQINYPAEISDDDKKRVEALLLAGAKFTERIGGKRRRGAGKCKITLLKVKSDNYLNCLAKTPPSPPVYQEITFPLSSHHPEIKQSDWYILPLEITAKSPLIINSRTVGNVVETLDYIPAKYILRNLHRKLGQWLNVSQAISEGSLVITNATVSSQNQPSRPVPFCLFADKLKGGLDKGDVYNRLVEDNPESVQLKGIRGGYVGEVTHNHLPIYRKVAINVYTHNTIEDDLQRPSSDVGGVYSYSAIAPKTTFRAEIRLKSDLFNHLSNQQNQWWKNLEDSYSIGQSKKDDYGTIKVTIAQKPQLYQGNIQLNNNTLSVWLLSDLLLRDERLNPTADLKILKTELEKVLGVKLKEREKEGLNSVMVRQRRTESWQVRWGLSRPSLVGIQAGSCLVYEVTQGELDINKLSQIQISGVGERRVEGYGQMCFNDPLLTMKLSTLPPSVTEVDTSNNNVNANPIRNNESSFEYARIIEREAWREAIRQQALYLASNQEKRKEYLGLTIQKKENNNESKPPMTQLGALRSIVSKLQSQNDKNQVSKWIEALESVPNRKEKWAGNNSLGLIRDLITQEGKIWEYLHLPNDLTITQNAETDLKNQFWKNLSITQNAETDLKNQLWAEAIRTLIDAMIRAHKRDWEETQ